MCCTGGALCLACSAAQTTVRARPLLHEDAVAYRGAYVVDIERRGSNTRGVLTVQDGQGLQQIYPLELASNTRKRLYLSLATYDQLYPLRRMAAPRLEWRGDDGETVQIHLPRPAPIHIPVVVVGNLIGGLDFLSRESVPLSTSLLAKSDTRQLPLKVYYWRARDVPDDWRALLDLPLIVLTEGAETLTDAQLRALHAWLSAGGTLMISTGSFISWRATPFATLIAPPPSAVAADYRVVQARQGVPILLQRRVGQGKLLLLRGDLSSAQWRSAADLPQLIRSVISFRSLPCEQLDELTEAELKWAGQPVRPARMEMGLVALGAYTALVWQMSVYLRRRRRLAAAFLPLLGLTTLGAVAVPLLAPHYARPAPQVSHVIYQSDAQPTVAFSTLRATLDAGVHRVRLPEGALLLRVETQPNAKLTLRDAAKPELELDCFGRTSVVVGFLRALQHPPRLQVQHSGKHLRLRNHSDEPLQEITLLRELPAPWEPTALWRQEKLMPKQTAQTAPVPTGLLAELSVRAKLPRQESTVTVSGKPVEEVSYLFVRVP
ncbi:MAG: hypothetical protein NZM10_01855 [Fimbriimonadales bacterium]|nr:hypothetical protein [Fimbriimonadales bacterium]